ncbi:MAG: histidine phosphatase family protein [Planctomycetaceae bacterium]|nr:histidine phosphatase family protein [Planctomycetaceae bacterium]
MTTLYLIAAGKSLWLEQQRLESPAGSPLAPGAEQDVAAIAEQLKGRGIEDIYSGPGEQELASIEIIAAALDVKARIEEELREMDFGLWQGLSAADFKRRQAKVYKLWVENPAAVRPPEGETLQQVQQRLAAALKDLAHKHEGESFAVVLRPMALVVAQCLLEGLSLDEVRAKVMGPFAWNSYEMDSREL